ncbi:MAG: transposase, partial [Rhodospirillales bacterium]
HTRGGRPEVKEALFMAAMAARNHNPDLKTFYTRLVENGKNPSSPSPPSCANS